MRTKLARMSKLSAENPEKVFGQLMHYLKLGDLESWYQLLNRKEAVGIDGITKENYGETFKRILKIYTIE